jgi:nitrous oxidase accessory protein NosD
MEMQGRQWKYLPVRIGFLAAPGFLLLIGLAGLVSSGASNSVGADGPHDQFVQMVSPGESIQAAIGRAAPHGWVLVRPGVYRETADSTNGLNITRSVHLVGLSTRRNRVILENSGGQLNGVVVVPSDRTRCMSCHLSLAPPFEIRAGVTRGLRMRNPMIDGVTISGITIRNFANNGLFTENVDGYVIDDVESVGNRNYGIFPTLSKNGIVTHSRVSGSEDAGLWVETSQNIRVTDNLLEDNVTGLEISNSDDILVADNESRNNSVGVGVFLLAGLFDDRPGAKRITIRRNFIHDNNKVNNARPGSLAAELPAGTGLLFLGADDSRITANRVVNNSLTGIALVDVCVAFAGGPHDCSIDPHVTPAFLADQDVSNTRVVNNVLINNGVNPPPGPFAFAASDLTLLSFGSGNCFAGNVFNSVFSLTGHLPQCP